MYLVKPYYAVFPINVPANMYKLSSHFECGNIENGADESCNEEKLNKLLNLQDYFLSQQCKVLEEIKNLKHLNIPNEVPTKQTLAKLNLLIHLNHYSLNDLPISLIILLKIMIGEMKNVQLKIYKHSSYNRSEICEHFKKLLAFQPIITNKDQMLHLNIMFKTNPYPIMLFDITGKLFIIGEINITRLLWRLYFTGSSSENEEICVDTVMESFLKFENNQIKDIFSETCVQKIVPKDNSLYIINNPLSLIDIYLWSHLYKNLTSKSSKPKNLWQAWFTNCSKHIKYFNIS